MLKIIDNKIYIVHGDDGSFRVNPKITDPTTGEKVPYEMKPGDKMILTVRKLPTESSPVLLSSVSTGTDLITIRRDQFENIECGVYSAEIDMIYENGLHDTVWTVDITKKDRTKVKNFENFHVVTEVPVSSEV